MEDIFRIVLYFQLFQSLHNFFSLGALWEDSIFGQFLIDVVGPCLYDVIRVWILCTGYRTNPVSDKKQKKPSLRRSEDFQRLMNFTRSRRIPLTLKHFRSWPEGILRLLEVFWPRSIYTSKSVPNNSENVPEVNAKTIEGMAKKRVIKYFMEMTHR